MDGKGSWTLWVSKQTVASAGAFSSKCKELMIPQYCGNCGLAVVVIIADTQSLAQSLAQPSELNDQE